MPTTPRPDVRACPRCSLTFPSRGALRRHDAQDHRPAPDGALLVAQILGSAPVDDAPGDGGVATAVRPAPTPSAVPPGAPSQPVAPVQTEPALPAGPPAPSSAPPDVRWALVLVLLCAAATALQLGPVAVALAALTWAHWARWHVVLRSAPPEDRRPSSA